MAKNPTTTCCGCPVKSQGQHIPCDKLIVHYKRHYAQNLAGQLRFYENLSSFADAIDKAAYALDENGHRHSHQRRIGIEAMRQARERLLNNSTAIGGCHDFQSLLELLQTVLENVHGVSELYVYDAALRIGANLKLSPSRIYLHRGTRIGSIKLGFDGTRRYLEKTELPEQLQSLSAAEIEDFLCIYKDHFGVCASTTNLDCEMPTTTTCANRRPC